MKKKIKMGCPNPDCNSFKKNVKYKSTIANCPNCGAELVHICKSKKCKTIVDSDHEAYCILCKAEKEDKKAVAGKVGAGAGAVAAGVGVKYRREILEIVKAIPRLLLKK